MILHTLNKSTQYHKLQKLKYKSTIKFKNNYLAIAFMYYEYVFINYNRMTIRMTNLNGSETQSMSRHI